MSANLQIAGIQLFYEDCLVSVCVDVCYFENLKRLGNRTLQSQESR